jgi:hypothetical protein
MNILQLVFPVLLAAYASLAAAAALPSDAAEPATALIFYAPSRPGPDMFPQLFQMIRIDLATGKEDLPGSAAWAEQPALLVGSDALRGVTYPNIVSVNLVGRCNPPSPGDHVSSNGPLGWVVKVSGNIQPFIYIDCDRINQVLRPAYAGAPKPQRRQLLSRAIARVLLHEWNHISTQTSTHGRRGLAQSALTMNDLISTREDKNLAAR